MWLLEQKLVDEQRAVAGGEEEWCLAMPGGGGVGVGKGGARGVEEEEEGEKEEGWHVEGERSSGRIGRSCWVGRKTFISPMQELVNYTLTLTVKWSP